MRYFVYILYSEKLKTFYKGHTNNLSIRINRHNAGIEKYTKKGSPWKLIWFTVKDNKSEAYQFELKLKNLSRSKSVNLMLKYKDGLEANQFFCK